MLDLVRSLSHWEIPFVFSFFFMGLVTGLHCVGMCGPILFTVFSPVSSQKLSSQKSSSYKLSSQKSGTGRFRLRLFYHLGRLTCYLSLAILLLLFGNGIFKMTGSLGFSLILIVLVSFLTQRFLKKSEIFQGFFRKILKRFSGGPSLFFAGLGSALLPCGPLYLVLGLAVGLGQGVATFSAMLAFSVGTLVSFEFLPIQSIRKLPYYRYVNVAIWILSVSLVTYRWVFVDPLVGQSCH